jgi:hypothetical protein
MQPEPRVRGLQVFPPPGPGPVGLGLPIPGRYRAAATLELRRRQHGLPPETVARAWTAQLRLCGRFRRLAARKHTRQVAVVAVARELAGFLWAEMTT